ncbi:MAG TPA: hypothetical protein VHL34_05270 [Rhizomicrobium sp.]|jgi:hypothetical protein|nr:hypothetical protein [Rhizomicrobium sp.]
MENVFFAFALMVISAFISLAAGKRAGKSKTFVYAFGLGIMLVQIAVLFTVRDWSGNAPLTGSLAQRITHTQAL